MGCEGFDAVGEVLVRGGKGRGAGRLGGGVRD